MKLTRRGERLLGNCLALGAVTIILAIMGLAGWIEGGN